MWTSEAAFGSMVILGILVLGVGGLITAMALANRRRENRKNGPHEQDNAGRNDPW